MAFRTLEITKPSELHVQEGQLTIEQEERVVRVPLEDIHNIICIGANIRISTMALSKLTEREIAVLMLDEKYRASGIVIPVDANARQAEVMCKQIEFDDLYKGIEIGKHSEHKGRKYDTITFAGPVVINGQRGNMAVVVRRDNNNYYKAHRLLMPDGTQFILDNKKDIAETVGEVENNLGLSPTDNVFEDSIHDSNKKSKVRKSDRTESNVYDVMGENERVESEDTKIKEDVERLEEYRSIGKKAGNFSVKDSQLKAVAKHFLNISNSKYAESSLVEDIKNLYNYLATTPKLMWNEVTSRCYEVADKILAEQSKSRVATDYFSGVLKDIRSESISLSEEQIAEAKKVYGDNYSLTSLQIWSIIKL